MPSTFAEYAFRLLRFIMSKVPVGTAIQIVGECVLLDREQALILFTNKETGELCYAEIHEVDELMRMLEQDG